MSKTPSIAVIPSGYKASKVYSVLPTNGDADLDFTRNCVATRVNQNGLLEEVGLNVPRLDYSDGGCPSLLLESQRTNYWTNSEGTDVTLNTPYGSFGFYTLIDSFESRTITNVGNVNLSFIIRKADGGLPILSTTGGVGDFYIMINGQSVKGLNGVLTDIGEGFYVYNLQETSDGTSISRIASINNSEINISLIQYEIGGYKTSYIPTSGIEVTRFKDEASKDNLQSYINSSEGVLYAEINSVSSDTPKRITLSDGSGDNRVEFGFDVLDNDLRVIIKENNNNILNLTLNGGFDFNSFNKIAIKYSSGDTQVFVNGVSIAQNSYIFSSIGTLDRLNFSTFNGLVSNFEGKLKDLRVYNEALTDAELIELTK